MAQDYNIQLDNLNKLKIMVLNLVESLNNYRSAYRAAIESSHENGLSVQMYERLHSNNLPRTSDRVKVMIENIEQIDICWISKIIDGFNSAMETAGNAIVSDSSEANASPLETTIDKADRFRAGTRKIVERVIIKSKKDDVGRPENERDMHADFLAAYFQNQKSR